MAKYIIKDLLAVCRYLPYGLITGIIVAIILSAINDRRIKKGKHPFSVVAITGFFMYIVVMLFITFWSREDGSIVGYDLELFSTWGINTRNNAYVIENILLFIPFGFLCAWVIPAARKLWSSTVIGFAVTLLIEYMQLFTGRGFFQIDDVLTNTLGAVIGYLIYCCTMKKNKWIYILTIALIGVLYCLLRHQIGTHCP
uniref:VanZ family protein n=1 Tax=Acetatifactor sp. TaxID=1872090 RepID=UPI0040579166